MATPTISAATPATIPANAGGTVTLTGTNFDTANVTAATINGEAVAFSITNGTTLVLTTNQAEVGLATVTVTNPTATATDTTHLTVTAFTQETQHTAQERTGTFHTAGAIFTNYLDDNYAQAYKSESNAERTYRQKLSKIVATRLYNTRYTPDISVATFL